MANRCAAASPCRTYFPASIPWCGILAALTRREKTGRGGYVDTALVDSTVGVLSFQALNYLVSGDVPKRIGNTHPNLVPYQVFPVADGLIIIATGNDGQFVKLCGILGAPELAQNPEYKDNKGRLSHRGVLVGKLSALTSQLKREELLGNSKAPAFRPAPLTTSNRFSPIRRWFTAACASTLKARRQKAARFPVSARQSCSTVRQWRSDRPSPALGEHTAEILREIGEK